MDGGQPSALVRSIQFVRKKQYGWVWVVLILTGFLVSSTTGYWLYTMLIPFKDYSFFKDIDDIERLEELQEEEPTPTGQSNLYRESKDDPREETPMQYFNNIEPGDETPDHVL